MADDAEAKVTGGGGRTNVLRTIIAILVALVLAAIIVLAILVADHRPDIGDNTVDIVALRKELADKIADLDTKLATATATAIATAAQLNGKIDTTKTDLTGDIANAKTELNGKIDTTKTDLTGEIGNAKAELNGNINQAKTELDGKIDTTKTDLTGEIGNAKTELNGNINQAKTELDGKIDTTKTDLTGEIGNAKTELNGNINQAKTELDGKIDTTKTDLTGEIGNAKTELNGNINQAKTELDGKIDTTKTDLLGDIANAKSELNGEIETAKADLTAEIGNAKSELNGNINQTKNELNVKIETAKTDLTEEIGNAKTELNGNIDQAKTDLTGGIREAKSELNGNINNAKSALDGKVNSTRDALDGKIGSTKNDLDGKIQDVDTKIEDAKADLQTKLSDVNENVDNNTRVIKEEIWPKLNKALNMDDVIQKINESFFQNSDAPYTACGGVVPATTKLIKYMPTSGKYENNLDCTWTINMGTTFAIKFNEFDLQPQSGADVSTCSDYVEFDEDGDKQKYCGTTTPGVFQVTSGQVSMQFKSDGGGANYQGFELEILETVTISSEGSEQRPYCTYYNSCPGWGAATKGVCADALCKAAGYEQGGAFVNATNNMCTSSGADPYENEIWTYSVDTDEFKFSKSRNDAGVTATCVKDSEVPPPQPITMEEIENEIKQMQAGYSTAAIYLGDEIKVTGSQTSRGAKSKEECIKDCRDNVSTSAYVNWDKRGTDCQCISLISNGSINIRKIPDKTYEVYAFVDRLG